MSAHKPTSYSSTVQETFLSADRCAAELMLFLLRNTRSSVRFSSVSTSSSVPAKAVRNRARYCCWMLSVGALHNNNR